MEKKGDENISCKEKHTQGLKFVSERSKQGVPNLFSLGYTVVNSETSGNSEILLEPDILNQLFICPSLIKYLVIF